MQTTLLGLAIAVILALVAALVAPLVVDWNQYRAVFEREASRLTGLAVRVDGTIDARILPTPRIKLHDVALGASGRDRQKVEASAVDLELGLGPLLRGKIEATELRLVAPQFDIGFDRAGAIDWPALPLAPESVAIAHLAIEDGRIVLNDAGSGTRLVLTKLWFSGDMRAAGPLRGEGAFVTGDELYGYRVSLARGSADGAYRLRLAVNPSARPLTAEIDGTIDVARGVPQFDGTLAMARPAATQLAGGERVMNEPWRLAGRLQATPAAASFKELTFQYGPQDRTVEFTGRAELSLGVAPRLEAAIAARQVDLDRSAAGPDATQRPPLQVAKDLLETFVAAVKPPLPVVLGVDIDAMMIGGSALQSLHGQVRYDAQGWRVDNLALRAPGFSDVALSGRLEMTRDGVAFSGPAQLESTDLNALLAWLEGRYERSTSPPQAVNAHGDVTIAGDRLALERLTADIDGGRIEGRLVYTSAGADRPAMLEAVVHGPELDIDALTGFATRAIGDNGLAAPRQVALALDIGKATIAGVDARQVNAQVKFDAGVLHIDRLSVGDLGGATLNIAGRIDELSSQPRGRITLDVDGRTLGGLNRVAEKYAPQAAAWLGRVAERLGPAKVHGVLAVDRAPSASGTAAKLDLTGQLGLLRLTLNGEATGEVTHPEQAALRLDGRLDADDGSVLARLLGVDGVLAVDQLPGQMKWSAVGPLNSDLRVNGVAVAGGFSIAVDGTLRPMAASALSGKLHVKASAADVQPLHRATAASDGDAVPLTASAAMAIAGSDLTFTDLAATIGKATLRGRLAVKTAKGAVDGDIQSADLDGGTAFAMLLGLAGAATNGVVTVKLDRVAFTPALVARGVAGVLRLQPSELAVSDIDGTLAGGRLSGGLALRRAAAGPAAQGHVELTGADAAMLFPAAKPAPGNRPGFDGAVTVKLQGDTSGASPEALLAGLHGGGVISLTNGHVGGLDPSAFDVAMRAADQAGTVDAAKIRGALSTVVENGRVAVPQGEADVTITGGQLRVTNATLPAERGAELSVNGMIDLNNATVDARVTLAAPPAASALVRARPELALAVKGPLAAPERTLDLSALTSWLTLRAAERQARRLESLEANRREETIAPAARPASPAVRFVPRGTAAEVAPLSAVTPPGPALGARDLDRLQPEVPIAAPEEKHSDGGPADHDTAAALPAPPAPLPDPSRPSTRTDGNAPASGSAELTRRRPPPQPAPRSLLDFLFRP